MIIGITGHKRAGKSSIADVLRNEYGFRAYSLAEPIKAAVREIFGWGPEHTDGARKEEVDPRYGISPRQAMQHLGTEWGQYGLCHQFPGFYRVTDRYLWCRRAMDRINADGYPRFHAVIPDIRFMHEREYFKPWSDFLLVRVRRAGCHSDGHASEEEIGKISADYIIENNRTLDDLADEVRALCAELEIEAVTMEEK